MDLSGLKPAAGSRKKRKRFGRGEASGHGGTSGRGHKGLKARAGASTRPGYEGGQMPLARRLPKRGFRNYFRKDIVIVNLEQLQDFPQGVVVEPQSLLDSGIIKRTGDGVKILGKGEIGRPLAVKINLISRSAREKIIAAGGSIEVI
jgi:large subunit ribosomal protein L15